MRKMNNKALLRVKSLSLNRFRGFAKSIKLETDADVVLLTGPNGFGKTSVIDALCLLLNGHFYPERVPLVFQVKTNIKNRNAYIEAEVEYRSFEDTIKEDTIKKDTIKIKVEENSKEPLIEKSPYESFCPDGISKELAARCSFYYQDLLSKLFEEEDTQVPRLLEFLRPLPGEVTLVQEALKNVQKKWKNSVANIREAFADKKALPREHELNEKRKDAAEKFREAWHNLVEVVKSEAGIALPERAKDWLLFTRGGNLRSGWERELRNLAAECLVLLLPEHSEPDKEGKPFVSLQLIEEAIVTLQNKVMAKKSDKVMAKKSEGNEKISLFLYNLPEDENIKFIPPQDWPKEEKGIDLLYEQLKKKEEQIKLLERLEKHFDNPEGASLLDVLLALRDKGKEWANIPQTNSLFYPPPEIIRWLQEIISSDLARLAELLENWQSETETKRRRFLQQRSDLQKTLQDKKAILDRSKQIYGFLQYPPLKSHFETLIDLIDQGSLISSSKLKEELEKHATGPSNNFLKAVDHVKKVILEWKQIEEFDEKTKEILRQEASYSKAKDLMDVVNNILEKETDKNSTLNKAIFPPDDIIEELQKIVNYVFNRFCLVEGIIPVRFEIKKVKKPQTEGFLQVYSSDGRPLSAFSTGQKAQLGLSMLLGFNYCFNRYIGHSVIALDDVTTAFDMSQLPRTAALIRQIAYATDDVSLRRQVFIVSHHEDLTNRFLDFLIPPEGKKMLILNFINWSPEKGPLIEQREVIPALKASEENRKSLSDRVDD